MTITESNLISKTFAQKRLNFLRIVNASQTHSKEFQYFSQKHSKELQYFSDNNDIF